MDAVIMTPTFPPKYVEGTDRKSGSIGIKVITQNGYEFQLVRTPQTAPDGKLTFLDVEKIKDYFYGVYAGQVTELQESDMDLAGLNVRIFPDATSGKVKIDGDTQEYDWNVTWKQVVYNDMTGGDNPNFVTLYDKLMQWFSLHLDILIPGDLNLDAQFDDDDLSVLSDILANSEQPGNPTDGISYLYDTLNTDLQDSFKSWIRAWQINTQGTLMNPNSHLFTDLDVIVYEKMLDNIFDVTSYPADQTVVLENSVGLWDVQYSVICRALPTYGSYYYEWFLKLDGGDWEKQQYENQNTFTIEASNISQSLDNSMVKVVIYDQIQETVPPGTDYSNPDYFRSRSYTARLYIYTPSLWGDCDNNGVVNVLDAYRVLNNFIYLKGDVDRDNRVDATDASSVLSYYSSVSTGSTPEVAAQGANPNCTPSDFLRADLNDDNLTDASDASLILAIYALLSENVSVEDAYETVGCSMIMDPYKPHTQADCASLVKPTPLAPRTPEVNRYRGELILQSIKNNNVRLY